MQRARIRTWLTVLIILCSGLVLLCSAGGTAVQQGIVEPPEINVTIDGIGLVAHTTNVPSCALWFVPCDVAPLGPAREMYAVWVVWQPVRAPGDELGAKRLFAMKIAP
jgi:hypothetical protein